MVFYLSHKNNLTSSCFFYVTPSLEIGIKINILIPSCVCLSSCCSFQLMVTENLLNETFSCRVYVFPFKTIIICVYFPQKRGFKGKEMENGEKKIFIRTNCSLLGG